MAYGLERQWKNAALVWSLCCTFYARGIIKGVAPDAQQKYELASGKAFRCLSGNGEEVPFSAVNDNFCDCADGSDEPGTGACAGQEQTMFHCNNEGSTPQLVYASRVDDGICDCCDGSDEAGLATRHPERSRCVNFCAEEGTREAGERAEKIQRLKVGLTKREEIQAKAALDRAEWQKQIADLQTSLSSLDAELKEAKAVKEKEDEEARRANATDHLIEDVETLKDTVRKLTTKVEELQARLAKFEANGGQPLTAPSTEPTDGSADAAKDVPVAGVEKKKEVVSEYAKWMDGAGDTPGAIDDGGADALADEEAARLAAEEEEGEEDEEDDLPHETKSVSSVGKAASPAALGVTEAEKKVRENKDETRRLQKKMRHVEDEAHIGFASLGDQCLEKNDGQYTYNLCFFDDVKQDSVLLGRWDKWTGPKTAHFSNGQMCPGGPARELSVIFECGSEIEVNEVMEPSRCVYETHVSHPGACDAADQAALEKPPVKHPRDEL